MYDEILCKRFSIPSVLSLNMRDIIQLIRKGDHHAFNRIVHQFQTSIPKSSYLIEDVLLQRAELETQYTYFASIGFSYSFGSIYNNVVNPRFGSQNGGYSFSISY